MISGKHRYNILYNYLVTSEEYKELIKLKQELKNKIIEYSVKSLTDGERKYYDLVKDRRDIKNYLKLQPASLDILSLWRWLLPLSKRLNTKTLYDIVHYHETKGGALIYLFDTSRMSRIRKELTRIDNIPPGLPLFVSLNSVPTETKEMEEFTALVDNYYKKLLGVHTTLVKISQTLLLPGLGLRMLRLEFKELYDLR
jgi:superfamily II DNA or RNA helicase